MKIFVTLLSTLTFSALAWATDIKSIHGIDVVTGKPVEISFPGEKSVALIFISAKCPCSASHEALLKDLSQSHPEVRFIGVHSNSDETVAQAEAHFKTVGLPFAVVRDEKNFYANLLGALKTPHAFVLDKEGRLLYQGGVTDSHVGPSAKKQYLKEVLEDLQSGKKSRHNEGRALGCYITRENS